MCRHILIAFYLKRVVGKIVNLVDGNNSDLFPFCVVIDFFHIVFPFLDFDNKKANLICTVLVFIKTAHI